MHEPTSMNNFESAFTKVIRSSPIRPISRATSHDCIHGVEKPSLKCKAVISWACCQESVYGEGSQDEVLGGSSDSNENTHVDSDPFKKMTEIKRIRCSKREFDILNSKETTSSSTKNATCFCEHGRKKSRCMDCGGSSICEHGRKKSERRDFGGAFCEHARIKWRCKAWGGAAICEHHRIKHLCKDCGGYSFCEHGRKKMRCNNCGGGAFSQHSRTKERSGKGKPLAANAREPRSKA